MAQNHSHILREGARPWNEWRATHPDVTPDLRYIELSLGQKQLGPVNGGPIDLRGALLFKADLRNATLIEADLRGAELVEAEFGGARLDNADLRGAKLVDSSLIGADFARARLDGADLTGADLTSARNLSQAQINAAVGDITTQLPFDLVMPKNWLSPQYGAAGASYPQPDVDGASSQKDNLYTILGAKKSDSDETIHAIYRVQAKSLHPDLNPGNPKAGGAFRRLTYAYAILRDPVRRKRYDSGEIGPDGEETEAYRYAVWRKARMGRLRAYAAFSAVLAAITCGVLLTQFDFMPSSTTAQSDDPGHTSQDAGKVIRPDDGQTVSNGAFSPKIQSRIEPLDQTALTPPSAAKDSQYVKDDEPDKASAGEQGLAETAEQAAIQPPVDTAEKAVVTPFQPEMGALNAQTAVTGNPPGEQDGASASRQSENAMLSLILISPQPTLKLGPRAEVVVAPSPFMKVRKEPALQPLSIFDVAPSMSPRLPACKPSTKPLIASFNWIGKFRADQGVCNPPRLSPIKRSGSQIDHRRLQRSPWKSVAK